METNSRLASRLHNVLKIPTFSAIANRPYKCWIKPRGVYATSLLKLRHSSH